MPITGRVSEAVAVEIGTDVTELLRVIKYDKPGMLYLPLEAIGNFPDFLPKTDEPNFQRVPYMVSRLQGLPFYMTLKTGRVLRNRIQVQRRIRRVQSQSPDQGRS